MKPHHREAVFGILFAQLQQGRYTFGINVGQKELRYSCRKSPLKHVIAVSIKLIQIKMGVGVYPLHGAKLTVFWAGWGNKTTEATFYIR
jgi:hypothetical protein